MPKEWPVTLLSVSDCVGTTFISNVDPAIDRFGKSDLLVQGNEPISCGQTITSGLLLVSYRYNDATCGLALQNSRGLLGDF